MTPEEEYLGTLRRLEQCLEATVRELTVLATGAMGQAHDSPMTWRAASEAMDALRSLRHAISDRRPT